MKEHEARNLIKLLNSEHFETAIKIIESLTKEEYEDFYQYVHKHNNCSFVFVGPGIYYKNLFELPEYNRISVIRKINDYRNRN